MEGPIIGEVLPGLKVERRRLAECAEMPKKDQVFVDFHVTAFKN